MEDSFQIIQDLKLDEKIPVSYFAVFDGHGGYQCAQFLRQRLHLNLVKAFLARRSGGLQNLIEADNFYQVIDELIGEAFMETDLQYQAAFGELSKQCGSTAVICLIVGKQLICANLGDARALMCRNGKAVDLSVDYKASRKDE